MFRPLSDVTLAGILFKAGQPCLWLDTAKTSSMEGAATTVYAQGGRGNPRLIAWEGEKTLTFTVEDALISEQSLAMLTGAGLAKVDAENVSYAHMTYEVRAENADALDLTKCFKDGEEVEFCVNNIMPAYAVVLNGAGGVKRYLPKALAHDEDMTAKQFTYIRDAETDPGIDEGDIVRVDCYIKKKQGQIITIDATNFAGYYYIEAETLFRDEETGKDIPATFVIPRGKIQSNFTFSMASTGDPSTFTFTIDAFPAYTKWDEMGAGSESPKRVLAAIQVLDDGDVTNDNTPHYAGGGDGDSETPYPYSDPSAFGTFEVKWVTGKGTYTTGSTISTGFVTSDISITAKSIAGETIAVPTPTFTSSAITGNTWINTAGTYPITFTTATGGITKTSTVSVKLQTA